MASPPNIVHVVADDLGWSDLGFAATTAPRTPNIDALAMGGVRLERFYAAKECAPSRTAIMTGRLPFQYGYYQNPSDEGGVPLNYTFLPEALQAAGYATHAIGKWHAGFRTKAYTPTWRGFDTFFGFYHWGEEYVDHAFPPYYKDAKCRGVDLSRGVGKQSLTPVNASGLRSAALFVETFGQILEDHPRGKPLYAYVAFQNAHDPYEQAPASQLRRQPAAAPTVLAQRRRNFSAIVGELDDAMGDVVGLLQQHGLYNNTLLWFNSDNGGELPFANQSRCGVDGCVSTACCGGAGSNLPLRGGKFTLHEGGIRSRSFVHAPSLLPEARRGGVWHGLSHVSDLFATFASMAGASLPMSASGHDLWSSIVSGGPSPRTELLHQPLNIFWSGQCASSDLSNPFSPSCGAALTVWPHKLIVGYAGDSRIVSPAGANGSLALTAGAVGKAASLAWSLYDVEADPAESTNLTESSPDIAQQLYDRLRALSTPQAMPQPADSLTPEPSDAECAVVQATGAWQPWEEASFVEA